MRFCPQARAACPILLSMGLAALQAARENHAIELYMQTLHITHTFAGGCGNGPCPEPDFVLADMRQESSTGVAVNNTTMIRSI